MSISALNIGVSALKAYQGAFDSSANNIANSNTKNYQVENASFQEATNGGVVVNISQASQQLAGQASAAANADLNNNDLTSNITDSLQYKIGFELSAKLVKTADEILGTLIDLKK